MGVLIRPRSNCTNCYDVGKGTRLMGLRDLSIPFPFNPSAFPDLEPRSLFMAVESSHTERVS